MKIQKEKDKYIGQGKQRTAWKKKTAIKDRSRKESNDNERS